MKPRFGPQPGERVRVRGVACGYPLRHGLKDDDIVLLKSWTGADYIAEFDGRELSLNPVQIVAPTLITDGRILCPDCKQELCHKGAFLVCPGCGFRCLRSSPAAVLD